MMGRSGARVLRCGAVAVVLGAVVAAAEAGPSLVDALALCVTERSDPISLLDRFRSDGWEPVPEAPHPDLRRWIAMAFLSEIAVPDLTVASPRTQWIEVEAALDAHVDRALAGRAIAATAEDMAHAAATLHDPESQAIAVVEIEGLGLGRAQMTCHVTVPSGTSDANVGRLLAPVPGGFAVEVERPNSRFSPTYATTLQIVPDPAAFEARLGWRPDVAGAIWTSMAYDPTLVAP